MRFTPSTRVQVVCRQARAQACAIYRFESLPRRTVYDCRSSIDRTA